MLAAAILTVLATGCQAITGTTEDVHHGVIGYPDDVDIRLPATVAVGESFVATVRTIGRDGCWSAHDTRLETSALAAEITPYDVSRVSRGHTCTQALRDILHTATLSFDEAGTAELRFVGRDGTAVRHVVVE